MLGSVVDLWAIQALVLGPLGSVRYGLSPVAHLTDRTNRRLKGLWLGEYTNPSTGSLAWL